ncbi:MAG TPA: type VI secretion system contractile sheath small subunit [Desulfobacterales bacterium]|nr:MAG: type VI secretion system contractile sheath small subunit [Deltaproteobacteria bacterium]HHC24003.1 type VI secretion system contractile sheath small subunit [Desulfobacterales bacterium]
MALASTQKKLSRVRPPRVQITYDVQVGDAIETKELPFVAGIMADLSGKPEEPLPKLKDRKFVDIDRDNFNDVMGAIGPRLVVQVDNKLKKDDKSNLNIELKFKNMDDFNPLNVVKQVKPLQKLYEARERLSDLLTKLDGNDELDDLLQDVVKNTEGMENIRKSYKQAGEGDK